METNKTAPAASKTGEVKEGSAATEPKAQVNQPTAPATDSSAAMAAAERDRIMGILSLTLFGAATFLVFNNLSSNADKVSDEIVTPLNNCRKMQSRLRS